MTCANRVVKVQGLMIWLRRSIVLAPVLTFLAAALLLSCGHGSSTTQTQFGPFALFSLAICAGPPATGTPTPVPTSSKTPKKTATPMCSPIPMVFVSPTAVPTNGFQFNLQGEISRNLQGKGKKLFHDFTRDSAAIWSFPSALEMEPNGLFIGLRPGCYCIDVSIGGIAADPVGVWVQCPLSDPSCKTTTPMACPTNVQACPTSTATAIPG